MVMVVGMEYVAVMIVAMRVVMIMAMVVIVAMVAVIVRHLCCSPRSKTQEGTFHPSRRRPINTISA
jgi:hypothetical protein